MMTQILLILMILLCYPSSCFGLSASGDESSCKAWEYGIDCQYNCSFSCNFHKCSITHHKGVPVCNNGCKKYYTGIFCQEFCPSLCLECNQTDGTCTKCINGYYGETCNKTCNRHCLNGTCDVDGHCIIAPHTGGKININSMNSEGPCLKRNENGTGCLCCKTKLRGDQCKTVCQNCQTYHIPNEKCEYQCQAGYYGTTCKDDCPLLCKHGNSGKPICKISGDVPKCMNGCNSGYTGLQCNDTCKGNCSSKTCYQIDGRCIHCPNGKYGDMCFETCSSGCHNRTCNRDGTCTVGCKTGSFGKTCNYTCPEACLSCKGDHSTDINCVFDCKPGYHGSLCKNKCSEGCQNNTCNKVDGRCAQGCKPGYHGSRCDKKCSEGCQVNICTFEGGSCISGCKNGFYRDNCTEICGDKCARNTCEEHFDSNNPTVPFLCSLGCKDGYKGRSCNEECPKHCLLCKQLSDDRCSQCYDGYKLGNKVDGNAPCIKTVPEDVPQLSNNVTVIVIVSVIVIAIVIIVFVVCYFRKQSGAESHRGVNNVELVSLVENGGNGEQGSNIANEECNDQSNNCLIQACLTGNLEAVKSILKQSKENINVRGRHGVTPIMEAIGNGHTKVTDFLLENGCDLLSAADNKDTVLHVASDRGNVELVKNLLDKKLFNINAKGNMGRSPLMIAARNGDRDLFDLLFKEGADINTRDCSNDTILHAACLSSNEEFYRYLRNQHFQNRTPAMLTTYNEYKKCFE